MKMTRPPKALNILSLVRQHLEAGRYRFTAHALERLNERDILQPEVFEALQNGVHEKKKDKFDEEHEILIGKSFCEHMNDLYEDKKIVVDRSVEKYQATWGAYLIPIVGEEVYIAIQNNPNLMEEIQKELDAKKI